MVVSICVSKRPLFLTQRLLLHQVVRFVLVALLEAEVVCASDDLQNEVQSMHRTSLTAQQVAMPSPGDVLYVPPCCVPCIIGYPFDADTGKMRVPGSKGYKPSKNMSEYAALLVTPIFDAKRDVQHSKHARAKMTEYIRAAGNGVPKSTRTNEKFIA